MCCILVLEKLYHHLFSTPAHDSTHIDQLKHYLVLWLTHLTFLDQWGVQVNIHPLVTTYINTLLEWAKCFLATYVVYPGLYDLLDTPRHEGLAVQLYLRDSTLPRPLLHQSRGLPTLRNEYVALQPHLAPPTPPEHLYVCHMTRLSFTSSVCHVTSLSVILPAPSVCPMTHPHVIMSVCHKDTSVCCTTCQSICQATHKSVTLSVHITASPSVVPVHLSYDPSIYHPINSSMTCPSVTPPISPTIHSSGCPTSSDCSSNL